MHSSVALAPPRTFRATRRAAVRPASQLAAGPHTGPDRERTAASIAVTATTSEFRMTGRGLGGSGREEEVREETLV